MSVGIGMIGRERTMTVGGATLAGVVSKGITFNNEPLDTSDDSASGWTELLALPGVKNVEMSISGVLKNLELINTWKSGSQIMAVVVTYPDASVLSFDGFMSSFAETGESNGLTTFDATFASSGVVTFTPGV